MSIYNKARTQNSSINNTITKQNNKQPIRMHAMYTLAIYITIIPQGHFSTSTNCMGHKIMYLRLLPANMKSH